MRDNGRKPEAELPCLSEWVLERPGCDGREGLFTALESSIRRAWLVEHWWDENERVWLGGRRKDGERVVLSSVQTVRR
jgi:hypothetical protein